MINKHLKKSLIYYDLLKEYSQSVQQTNMTFMYQHMVWSIQGDFFLILRVFLIRCFIEFFKEIETSCDIFFAVISNK